MASRRRAGLALLAAFALATSWTSSPRPVVATPSPLGMTPDPLDLGSVQWGQSAATDATITNNSGAGLTITSLDISTDAAEFSITGGTCVATLPLAAAATCTVNVTFAPHTAGAQSAGWLHIVTSAGDFFGALHGTGLDMVSVGGPIDFGNQPKGSTHAALNGTIDNMGTSSLNPASALISGPNAADFHKVSDTCTGQAIATSFGCTVGITFKPTALGLRTATLTITGPFPLSTRTIALSGTGTAPYSTVKWGATFLAGPNFTVNDGGSLSRTVKSGVQQLHATYDTDVIGGKDVTDKGPYAGVFYIRATNGAKWSTPKRVNPATQHGERSTSAAAGSRVYVAWVREPKFVDYTSTAPRVIYLRVNTNHGASTAWKTAKRLTSTSGRVDFPVVAASGSDVHVVWTDSNSGAIRIATSRDGGSTFKTRTIGTTTWSSPDGLEGVPWVGASGANVVVAWAADDTGKLVTRASANHGSTWGATTVLATSSTGAIVNAVIRGTRAAVVWEDADGIIVRVRTGGTWGPARVVAEANANEQYSPAVALQDPNRVAVSWAEWDGSGTTLFWAESPNNGAAFYQPQTLAAQSVASHTENDYPSIVWATASTRIVLFNGYDGTGDSDRLFVRIGTGTPSGLTAPAPLALTGGRATARGLTVHHGGGSSNR